MTRNEEIFRQRLLGKMYSEIGKMYNITGKRSNDICHREWRKVRRCISATPITRPIDESCIEGVWIHFDYLGMIGCSLELDGPMILHGRHQVNQRVRELVYRR